MAAARGIEPRTLTPLVPQRAVVVPQLVLDVLGRQARGDELRRRAPAVVRTKPASPTPPAQSLADVALDVQLVGTRRVALWVPTASCDDATQTPLRRVDVVLSPGDGLFVPFQWWVAESDAAGDGSGGGETGGPSRWCALR